ncbi:hypothetical protein ACTHGU_22020 [Chitinophagaceae bacterium MMS25-I14]
MNKTLHRTFSPSSQSIAGKGSHTEKKMLGAVSNDLRGFWKEAADDLLQPRPEAVASLLEKISRLN